MYNTEACHEFAGLISACMQQGSFRRNIRAVVPFKWPNLDLPLQRQTRYRSNNWPVFKVCKAAKVAADFKSYFMTH